MKPPEKIQTKELLLRRIEISDAKRMFDSYSCDPEVAKYMSWRLTGKFEDTLCFVKTAIDWWNTPETAADFVYAIQNLESGEFIGCCSAGPHSAGCQYHWGLGYNLARKFWGRGYGTQVVTVLSQELMKRPEIFRLSAVVDTENIASARVLEKSGCSREGTLRRYAIHPNRSSEPRDIHLYSLIK